MQLTYRISVIFLVGVLINFYLVEAADSGKIATYPACKDDVTRLCSKEVLPNDLAVLDCLQNRRSDSDSDIKTECHSVSLMHVLYNCRSFYWMINDFILNYYTWQFLWQFKLNLTKGDQFLEAAEKMCSDELKTLDECRDQSQEGHKLSCLLENADSVAQGITLYPAVNDICIYSCTLFCLIRTMQDISCEDWFHNLQWFPLSWKIHHSMQWWYCQIQLWPARFWRRSMFIILKRNWKIF